MKFFDGLPDQDTVQKVYDNLDRMRGVDVFLNTLAPASLLANIEGLKSVGCDNYSAVIHEDRVDAKTLLLTSPYVNDIVPIATVREIYVGIPVPTLIEAPFDVVSALANIADSSRKWRHVRDVH